MFFVIFLLFFYLISASIVNISYNGNMTNIYAMHAIQGIYDHTHPDVMGVARLGGVYISVTRHSVYSRSRLSRAPSC